MEKYSLQIWDTMDDNIKPRTIVRQPRLQELLLGTGDQETVFIFGTSVSQWIDKSDELNAAKDHQSSAGEGKGHMAEERPLMRTVTTIN